MKRCPKCGGTSPKVKFEAQFFNFHPSTEMCVECVRKHRARIAIKNAMLEAKFASVLAEL